MRFGETPLSRYILPGQNTRQPGGIPVIEIHSNTSLHQPVRLEKLIFGEHL
jgi:hypothetical protein